MNRNGNEKNSDAIRQNGYQNTAAYGQGGQRTQNGYDTRQNPRAGAARNPRSGRYGNSRPAQGSNTGAQRSGGTAPGYNNTYRPAQPSPYGRAPQRPQADPRYAQNRAGGAQPRGTQNRAYGQNVPRRRRHPDFRTGFAERKYVRKRPGIKGYESTAESDNSYKKILIIACAIIVFAVILALVIKVATTEHIDTLPDVPKETQSDRNEPAETQPDPTPQLTGYAKRTEETVTLGSTIDCTNAILIDTESNTVVAEKGGDEKIFPASMTKVMTALVAIEHCDDLNDTFVMTNQIIDPLFAANASVAGFAPGEELTVKDLLYGTILPSGADATGALAVYTAGSEEAFAEMMNEKCKELGLTGTHFSDASGLHKDDHYSTCHDIALIMRAALENETLKEVLGTDEYTTSKTTQHPDGIPLQNTMYSRVDGKEEFDGKIKITGGKTGYTGEAKNCLVSCAQVVGEEKTWIFVCAGGESKWKPIYDTIHVYRTFLGVHYDSEYTPKYLR